MSALGGPLPLWLAGLICVAIGLRTREPSRSSDARGRSAAVIPVPLRVAMGLRWPTAACARLERGRDQADIERAGLRGDVGAADLARMRVTCGFAGVLVAAVLALAAPVAALLAPVLAGLGALGPGRWVVRRQQVRHRALMRELPDLLDLLGICVEAGMALDPALSLSCERLGGTLGQELQIVLRDLSLGSPRRSAYGDLIERTGSPEVTRAVGALLQAEELGAPLSRALQGQAEALRAARRQDARETAARAAPKIQLVVAMVMVPAVLLLVLGVLIIELSRQVGAVIG